MNTTAHQPPAGAINTRQLWAAVAVLGIAVVALGASLVHIQTQPVDGVTALAALDPPAADAQDATVDDPATPLPVTTVGQGETVLAAPPASAQPQPMPTAPPAGIRKSPSSPVTQAPTRPTAPPKISKTAVQHAPAPRAVCAACGRVESVKAVERKGEAHGVGAVAGGVLGAVLGNQVGKGNGRAIATVLGAVGGGMAGNTIEKNVTGTTVYQVQVRMHDGSLRMLEQTVAPAIGSAVIVEDPQMRPTGDPAPRTQGRAPAPAPPPAAMAQGQVYRSERN